MCVCVCVCECHPLFEFLPDCTWGKSYVQTQRHTFFAAAGTAVCVCVCVCVRERERERERLVNQLPSKSVKQEELSVAADACRHFLGFQS